MLIFILLCVLITQTYSLHTEHYHNRVLRRKTEYRINITMSDDDIEMVDFDKFIDFSNKGILFNKTHHRKSQIRNLVRKNNNTTLYPKVIEAVQNLTQINLISTRNYSNHPLMKGSYRGATSADGEKSELEMQENQPRIARDISADRMWNIIQIWSIIYFVLAIPLWCTIGRCCCCLVCKCFRAQETIREAKQYAMWNPPGVLRKKTGDVIYTPSEKEKEAYEELEHLIRTL